MKQMREYAAKLHVVETNMESNNDPLDTKELIARDYDDFSITTQATKTEGLKEAVECEEKIKWMLTAAQLKVEIWRSLEATNRSVDNHAR